MKPRTRIRRYLVEQYRAIADGEAGLRSDQGSVHAVRVGVRRFRSTVRTFRPLFPPAPAKHLEAELGWYGTLLGEVRDRQVQRRHLAEAVAELPAELVMGPVAARIEQDLLREQVAHIGELLAALDSDRYRALLAELAAWAQDPPLTRRVRPRKLRRLVRRSAARTRRLIGREEYPDDAGWHRLRKAATRSRYAAELAGPLLPHPRRVARRFERLQSVLGDHQDTVVARELLRRWGAATADDPGQNGFTFGLLHEREAEYAMWERATAGCLRV